MSDWPFIIMRIYGDGVKNADYLKLLFAYNREHPCVDEIWMSTSGWTEPPKAIEESIASCEAVREECLASGIQFSYQQGVTLNHAADMQKREHIPEDAWSVNKDGEIQYGVLCPNSDFARELNRATAEKVMSRLKPASYWPDDDLRLFKNSSNLLCFCETCLAKFNRLYHHNLTREQLREGLFGEHFSSDLRREWTSFNGQNLKEFAAVYYEAKEKVLPECRLGIQTISSIEQYDGKDFSPMLEGLSGPRREEVGIRPGAGYYTDAAPRLMFNKAMNVLREAARCKPLGYVKQICYEAENWPHISALKSPQAQMTEAALMLSSGANSLALYWGTDMNRESDENDRFYLDTLREYLPFFKRLRRAVAETQPAGVALYWGQNSLGLEQWTSRDNETEAKLLPNAFPLTAMEAAPQAYFLSERLVDSLAPADFPICFSKTVIMDLAAFDALQKRFPKLQFTQKVALRLFVNMAMATSSRIAVEQCNGGIASDCNGYLTNCASDVRALTQMDNGAVGSAIIPTEFGGNVILIQTYQRPWTGYRRQVILDALDACVPGKMAARVLTDGFAVSVQAHVSLQGECAAVFLLNASIGKTAELTVSIRRPAVGHWHIVTPEGGDVPAVVVRQSPDEVTLRLPSLAAWQPMLVTTCAS